eukprot:COSAG01_NODE_1382_length_10521_cov_61.545001_2_plen_41_part_00
MGEKSDLRPRWCVSSGVKEDWIQVHSRLVYDVVTSERAGQ